VVLLHVDVRNDIVVAVSVFSGSEVPRFILRVVISSLESFELVFEFEHVVGLLVAERSVLV